MPRTRAPRHRVIRSIRRGAERRPGTQAGAEFASVREGASRRRRVACAPPRAPLSQGCPRFVCKLGRAAWRGRRIPLVQGLHHARSPPRASRREPRRCFARFTNTSASDPRHSRRDDRRSAASRPLCRAPRRGQGRGDPANVRRNGADPPRGSRIQSPRRKPIRKPTSLTRTGLPSNMPSVTPIGDESLKDGWTCRRRLRTASGRIKGRMPNRSVTPRTRPARVALEHIRPRTTGSRNRSNKSNVGMTF